ncbi:acetoacetate-CoA ligase [Hortaea werneckii]|nr:acetoacetate-CoA ligase [Hortaea werneckii]
MVASSKVPERLWQPTNTSKTPMDRYRRHLNEKYRVDLQTTQEVHRWSVQHPQDFWLDLYDYLGLRPKLPQGMRKAYDDTVPMSSNPPFFPGLRMNYAENALFANPDPDSIALIGIREGQALDDAEQLTWHDFRERVRLTASALRRSGIKHGDRVAALVATSVWAMILFHATASIGAIFTSISPELGLEGCVSRLQQVTPSILFTDSDTMYKGKTVETTKKVQQILDRLQPKPQTYFIPITSKPQTFSTVTDFLAKANPLDPLTFAPTSFNDPLMICYSSGTTGAPKCIVHRHGIIIQLKKISAIHNSTTPADVILQYSSTSWVVFYIMCGYFACGAKTIVYNGSPLYPDVTHLLRMVEKFGVTYFGTSPRYLLELEMSQVIPKHQFDLSSLRIVYTTGATLSAEQYKWFYRTAFPPHIHLCNTAGGTDTATSLLAADPCGPVYAGEMQIFGLGMDVDILDPTTAHSILATGEAGEMVIRKPYPSMPCFFWGDDGDHTKYRESYFARFSAIDVWAQHDWLSRNPATAGLVMHGRSDGVLNPSGIRFGSGGIYAVVEAAPFNRIVSNSLCVGRRRAGDRDEEVFLFVVMVEGQALTESVSDQIKQAIREALSPRHVPRFVLAVPGIPVTINGKKVETAIKQILSGKDVRPSNTVANPETFAYFKRFRDLESEPRRAKL